MRRKKEKISFLTAFLVLAFFGLVVVIGLQYIKNKRFEESYFSLVPGETLPALDLISLDNIRVNLSEIKGPLALIIFKTPCTTCNANLNVWKNLAQYFGERVNMMGIISDGDTKAAAEFIGDKVANFKIYMPMDKEAFKKQMRLKLNMAQTIIVYNNKVREVKLGVLSADDLNALIAAFKKIVAAT